MSHAWTAMRVQPWRLASSKANASAASEPGVASMPTTIAGVVGRCLADRDDGARGVRGHLGCDGAEDEAGEAAATSRAHHDDVGRLRGLQKHPAGSADGDRGEHVEGAQCRRERLELVVRVRLQLADELGRRREARPEAACCDRGEDGVDDRQAPATERCLSGRPGHGEVGLRRAVIAHHDTTVVHRFLRHRHSMASCGGQGTGIPTPNRGTKVPQIPIAPEGVRRSGCA